MLTVITQALLTVALLSSDRWSELAIWELEQSDALMYSVQIDGINIYRKENEIIWATDIEHIGEIEEADLDWDKILVFGDGTESIQGVRGAVVKRITQKK